MVTENAHKYFEIEYLGALACFIALESQGRVTVWSPPKNRGGRILFKTTPTHRQSGVVMVEKYLLERIIYPNAEKCIHYITFGKI